MNLMAFLAILAILINSMCVLCYSPHSGGVNTIPNDVNIIPLMQTGQYLPKDSTDIDSTDGVAEIPIALNLLPSNPVQRPDSTKYDTENIDETNFQNDYYPTNFDIYSSIFGNNEKLLEKFNQLEKDIIDEEDIATKSALLLKLLQEVPEQSILPVVYVEGEDEPDDEYDAQYLKKRSGRYYRRYPWKRQNSRSRSYVSKSRKYDPESGYLCVPSREDVYKLLIGLHENRKGNMRKTINFCNRKRQAKQIFTHIRFLG